MTLPKPLKIAGYFTVAAVVIFSCLLAIFAFIGLGVVVLASYADEKVGAASIGVLGAIVGGLLGGAGAIVGAERQARRSREAYEAQRRDEQRAATVQLCKILTAELDQIAQGTATLQNACSQVWAKIVVADILGVPVSDRLDPKALELIEPVVFRASVNQLGILPLPFCEACIKLNSYVQRVRTLTTGDARSMITRALTILPKVGLYAHAQSAAMRRYLSAVEAGKSPPTSEAAPTRSEWEAAAKLFGAKLPDKNPDEQDTQP